MTPPLLSSVRQSRVARLGTLLSVTLILIACGERRGDPRGDNDDIVVASEPSLWKQVQGRTNASLQPRLFGIPNSRAFQVTYQDPAEEEWSVASHNRQVLLIGEPEDAWVVDALSRARDTPSEIPPAPALFELQDVWAEDQQVMVLLVPPTDPRRTVLDKLDELMDQTIALMNQGIATGMLPPKATMQRVPAQIAKQLVENPEDSLFYKAFINMPQGIPKSDATKIQARAREVISTKVIPAYRRLNTYFNDVYYPACRTSFGVSDLPNGERYYEYLVKRFTTTDMTPDEVHQIGLDEVKRIRSEMESAISETEFTGSFDEFVHFLRTDPQFYYDTPEALFEGYLAMSKRLDPMLVNLFGRLPRMPYGLKKIPDVSAPDTTTAYYSSPAADGSRAGYYYVNLYKPETRPKWEMAVLSVHESVPGHHLQIALQQELEQLPNFRRYSGFTVFIEGWGLYSEQLGYDMGLYEDPYDRFGQLTYDMWRAVRLVVDTGMHYKGWSRQRAIDYFKSNAPKSELDIINEIDRYISMPGQALAYKIGQLKILALRAEAEQRLGEEFDIKAFHDIVLGSGAIPLDVLQTNVRDWLDQQTKDLKTGVRS